MDGRSFHTIRILYVLSCWKHSPTLEDARSAVQLTPRIDERWQNAEGSGQRSPGPKARCTTRPANELVKGVAESHRLLLLMNSALRVWISPDPSPFGRLSSGTKFLWTCI